MSISSTNRRQLIDDYRRRVESVSSFPAVMYVESTRGCPCACIMCSVPETFGRRSQDLPLALLKKIYPAFKHLEILAIHGNGEPLLSRNIDWFVRAALDHDCTLHMNTTGWHLTPSLAETLLAARLSIRFSIHAGTGETYRKIMGGDLERVKKQLANLVDRGARIGSPGNDFWLSFIVMKENVDEMEHFLILAKEVGIKKVRFMRLNPNDRIATGVPHGKPQVAFRFAEQFGRETRERFLRTLPRVTAKAGELGLTIGPGSMEYAAGGEPEIPDERNDTSDLASKDPVPARRRGSCVAPWIGQVQIRQNGDVGLCCGTDYYLGNLYEQSLAEIWNDFRLRHIRAGFRTGYVPRECGACRTIGAGEYAAPVFGELLAQEG